MAESENIKVFTSSIYMLYTDGDEGFVFASIDTEDGKCICAFSTAENAVAFRKRNDRYQRHLLIETNNIGGIINAVHADGFQLCLDPEQNPDGTVSMKIIGGAKLISPQADA